MARKKKIDTSPDIELGSIEDSRSPSLEAQAQAAAMIAANGVPQTNGKGEPVSALTGFQITSNGHVTQTALREYQSLIRQKREAAARIKEFESKINLLEAELIKAWEDGKRSEPGPDKMQLNVRLGEKSQPKWKEEALILALAAGKNMIDYEAEISAKYKKPTVTIEVI